MPPKKQTKTSKAAPKKETLADLEVQSLKELRADLHHLLKLFEGIGFNDFLKYASSKKQIFWSNFWGGIARGLGIVVGMTVVVALLVWMLAQLVDFPLIGQYFEDLKSLLEALGPVR